MLIAAGKEGKVRDKEYKSLRNQVSLVPLLMERTVFHVLLLTVARETKSYSTGERLNRYFQSFIFTYKVQTIHRGKVFLTLIPPK